MPTTKTPIFIVLILIIVIGLAACSSPGGSSATSSSAGKGETAAVVNGTKITIAEVDRVTAEQAQGQQSQLSQLELAAARLKVLESLITNEILYQRAKKENLIPNEQDVTTYIQNQKASSGMTEEAFQKRLKDTNQSEAEFKEDIRKSIAVSKLQENINNQIKVSDREVEDFFKVNPPVAAAGIALSDIVADPAQNAAGNNPSDAKGEAEAKAKIDGISAQLKGGADFATIARAQSEDANSQLRGGDLGFIPMEQLQQTFGPLAGRIAAMKEGDRTEAIRDGSGRWHIFKMTGKRTETKKLTLDDPEVKKQITDEIRNQRASLLYSALIAQARDESKVENYLIADLVKNPNSLGVLRPVNPQAATSPAASPAASAAASTAASVAPATVASAAPSAAATQKK